MEDCRKCLHEEVCVWAKVCVGRPPECKHFMDKDERPKLRDRRFTGLTDKNGKKIFEGDVCRYRQVDGARRNGNPIICTGTVVYHTKTASFAIEGKDDESVRYFDYFPIKGIEVLGTSYDNPVLLETEEGAS